MRRFIAALVLGIVVVSTTWAGGVAEHSKHHWLKVSRIVPHHLSTLVPVNVTIGVKFSRSLDVASIGPATVQLVGLVSGADVPVTYTIAPSGRKLWVRPVERLAAGTDYRLVVRPGLLALDGSTLRAERFANFFTNPTVTLPPLLRLDQFEDLSSPMIEGRAAHSAVTLGDGSVLLAGGMTTYTQYATTGDRFDPRTNEFHPAGGELAVGRAYSPCVRLGSGALLVGGSGLSGALDTTELYDLGSGQFTAGPKLLEQRDYVDAVTLKDGRILVTGGLHYPAAGGAVYSSTAEIYDPATGSFRFTAGSPVTRRAGHTLTLLPSGKVLVVGGQSGENVPVTAELFDPVTETFTQTASGPAYLRQLHTATVLDATGTVLLADGGAGLLELYDPLTDSFRSSGYASSVRRTGATASLLPNGDVLFAGGITDNGSQQIVLDSFDLYMKDGGIRRPSVAFTEPRYGHTATVLGDGRVLFAGGFGTKSSDSLKTAVLFTPDPPK